MSISTTSASMPAAIQAAFQPTLPAPSTTTLAGPDARSAAHEHAATAVVAFEAVGAHLRREPAGHLAHRGEERERAVVGLHRLVGDRRRAGVEECLRHAGVRGQMEVGEQREIGTEEAELLFLRLLHLDDHLL